MLGTISVVVVFLLGFFVAGWYCHSSLAPGRVSTITIIITKLTTIADFGFGLIFVFVLEISTNKWIFTCNKCLFVKFRIWLLKRGTLLRDTKLSFSENKQRCPIWGDILPGYLKLKVYCHFQRTREDVPRHPRATISTLSAPHSAIHHL